MASEKRSSIAKSFLRHLARGGAKTIPIAGGLIEQMIFGTGDEVTAKQETEKLNNTLADIQKGIEGQSVGVSEVVERLKAEADFREETTAKIDELIAAIGDVEEAQISDEMEESMERFFQRHGQRVEDAVENLDAMLDRLEDILTHTQTPQVATAVEGVDRVLLLLALNKLDPVSLSFLIVALDASRHVSQVAASQQRVSELVQWAEGVGPGLDKVYGTATKVIPNFG